MCGIAGLASPASTTSLESLIAMRDSMGHRGPDDAGAWQSPDGRVGLAHRRLAIIDLSPAGHQPMNDARGQAWIVFNGEIYNYRELRAELESHGYPFRTSSDTEVILAAYHAWGTDCLSRLNGMFAFGLYDSSARRLFLARDRAGEKPLFYRHAAGKLAFASELKALMSDSSMPRQIDWQALDFYLTYGYVPGQMCMLKDVHKLPQGHAMTYDLEHDRLRVWSYWSLPDRPASESHSEDELLEELAALLKDSIRRQMVADVPVGILLSGGIDSSLVTAFAAQTGPQPVNTFTVTFPGSGSYDEAPYAKRIAEHFGTQHHELVAEPTTVDLLPELARQFDEPMADSSMVPTFLVSRLIREHAKVALGGDGGDELFGGYFHHGWVLRLDRQRRLIPGPLRKLCGLAAQRLLPVGLKGRNYLVALGEDLPGSVSQFNQYFDLHTRRRLLPGAPHFLQRSRTASYKTQLCERYATPLQKATAVDFRTYLVDDILVKVDRASMLASLEVRAPWLDYRLIEFAFSRVPDRLRATRRERKILPRRLAERFLPRDLDLRRKQGFSLPLSEWFRGGWGDYIREVLYDSEAGLFDRKAIDGLFAGQRRGRSNTQRLFALAMFELWRREYRVAV